jgi:hypothetical protein
VNRTYQPGDRIGTELDGQRRAVTERSSVDGCVSDPALRRFLDAVVVPALLDRLAREAERPAA